MKRLAALFLIISTAASAQTISSVSADSMVAGETVIITGADFPAKENAAPILWDDFEDGVAGELLESDRVAISNITSSGDSTIVDTSADHGFTAGDIVYFTDVGGMTEANIRNSSNRGYPYTVSYVTDSNTFSVQVNSSGWSSYTSGGYAHPRYDSYGATGSMYNDGSTTHNGSGGGIDGSPYAGSLCSSNRNMGSAAPAYPTYNRGGFYTNVFYFQPTDTIFVSYKWRYEVYDMEADGLQGPIKNLRASGYHPSTNVYGEGGWFWGGMIPGWTGNTLYMQRGGYTTTKPSPSYEGYSSISLAGPGDWAAVEIYRAMATLDQADGHVRISSNATLRHNDTTSDNRPDRSESPPIKFWSIWIGNVPANCGNDPPHDCDIQVSTDNLYVDSTMVRVELGDASSFTSCTKREVQPATYWSAANDSINITLNVGTFQADDTAYLFVVNADGTTSTGYPVTIGGSPPSSSPPGQPTVSRVGTTATVSWTASSPAPVLCYQVEVIEASGLRHVRTVPATTLTCDIEVSGTAQLRTKVYAVDADGTVQSESPQRVTAGS